MRVEELLSNINKEDQKVAKSVQQTLPKVKKLVSEIIHRMMEGGRLFYIGAGTSGRLGIVDASECPPTFGVPLDLVIGLIAGGDEAMRKAVEFAEDDYDQGWKDILKYDPNEKDTVIGIAASGKTPYVIGAIEQAKQKSLLTGCITCNEGSKLAEIAEFPIEVNVGPEFVTGSTRMKAATAQKMILNMVSTSVMIKLGHVEGNKMVDMKLSNKKLMNRALQMILAQRSISEREARRLLERHRSVRKVLQATK